MKALKPFLQHHLNALHCFCRLRPLIGRRLAEVLAKSWEHSPWYRLIYT